jgi:hypothetical protein
LVVFDLGITERGPKLAEIGLLGEPEGLVADLDNHNQVFAKVLLKRLGPLVKQRQLLVARG